MGLGGYDKMLQKLPAEMAVGQLKFMGASDMLSIACRTGPCAAKDLGVDHFRSDGGYKGDNPLVETVQNDTVHMKITHPAYVGVGYREYFLSRWAYVNVLQDFRPTDFDDIAQHHKQHGFATIKTSDAARQVLVHTLHLQSRCQIDHFGNSNFIVLQRMRCST